MGAEEGRRVAALGSDPKKKGQFGRLTKYGRTRAVSWGGIRTTDAAPRVKVSAEAARRFLVARHLLAPARSVEGGPEAVLEVFRRLGSIQFDPLAVAGRNHDLVLPRARGRLRPGMVRGAPLRAPRAVRGIQQGPLAAADERAAVVQRVVAAERAAARGGHPRRARRGRRRRSSSGSARRDHSRRSTSSAARPSTGSGRRRTSRAPCSRRTR